MRHPGNKDHWRYRVPSLRSGLQKQRRYSGGGIPAGDTSSIQDNQKQKTLRYTRDSQVCRSFTALSGQGSLAKLGISEKAALWISGYLMLMLMICAPLTT